MESPPKVKQDADGQIYPLFLTREQRLFLREHSFHSRELTSVISKNYLDLETMTPSICNDVKACTQGQRLLGMDQWFHMYRKCRSNWSIFKRKRSLRNWMQSSHYHLVNDLVITSHHSYTPRLKSFWRDNPY